MDGYVTTRLIRGTDALARMPVIALTAGAFSTQRTLALEAGVDDFVAKPFEVDQLIQAILDLVRRSSVARGGMRAQGVHATPPIEPQALQVVMAVPQVLNAERALRVWREPANLLTYLRKFAASHQATAHQLAELPPQAAAALAHQVKGAAAQLGLEQLAGLAGRMELLLRREEEAQDILMELQTAMEAAFRAIANYSADVRAEAPAPAAEAPLPGAWTGGWASGLQQLREVLRSDDPALVEPVLDALSAEIPSPYLGALRSALAAYDFRGAEGLVRELAAGTNVEKEIEP
jgi:CheY-like chemotaxis protein